VDRADFRAWVEIPPAMAARSPAGACSVTLSGVCRRSPSSRRTRAREAGILAGGPMVIVCGSA